MNSDLARHMFWAILFINFHAVVPKILTTDDSCPCIPAEECTDDSQLLRTNSRVLILPCSSDRLVRCCSVIRKSMESSNRNSPLQNIDQRDQLAEETKEKVVTNEETTQFAENAIDNVTRADESFEEYSTSEPLATETPLEEVISPTTQISTYSSIMNVNDVEDRKVGPPSNTRAMSITNGNQQLSSQQYVSAQRQDQLRYINWRQFLEPRSTRMRILEESATVPSSTIRLLQPERTTRQPERRNKIVVGSFDTEEEKLINQLMSFESTKIPKVSHPKKRRASTIKEAIELKEENPAVKIRRLFPKKAILDNGHRATVKFSSATQKRF